LRWLQNAHVKFAELLASNNVDEELLLELVFYPLEYFNIKTIGYYFREWWWFNEL